MAAKTRSADELFQYAFNRSQLRLQSKSNQIIEKNTVKKTTLPGKLVDCSYDGNKGTEIFLLKETQLVDRQNKLEIDKRRLYCLKGENFKCDQRWTR